MSWKKLEVRPTEEKTKESHVRWHGHVHRRPIDVNIKNSDLIHVEDCKRNRGRPRITWVEVMRNYMTILNLTECMDA